MSRKILLICGIISSLLYIAMNIVVPFQFNNYSSASQTVSELSAVGAPTRTLWVWLGNLYTVLVIAFGCGVRRSANRNRSLRAAGNLIIVYGVISLIWPFVPMHQREFLASKGEMLTDKLHLALTMTTVLLMTISIAFGAIALGKQFRLYSIFTILALFLFGILTGMDAPNIRANLPTPYAGVWERIDIGVFLFWIIILAILLLRKQMHSGPLTIAGNKRQQRKIRL